MIPWIIGGALLAAFLVLVYRMQQNKMVTVPLVHNAPIVPVAPVATGVPGAQVGYDLASYCEQAALVYGTLPQICLEYYNPYNIYDAGN